MLKTSYILIGKGKKVPTVARRHKRPSTHGGESPIGSCQHEQIKPSAANCYDRKTCDMYANLNSLQNFTHTNLFRKIVSVKIN